MEHVDFSRRSVKRRNATSSGTEFAFRTHTTTARAFAHETLVCASGRVSGVGVGCTTVDSFTSIGPLAGTRSICAFVEELVLVQFSVSGEIQLISFLQKVNFFFCLVRIREKVQRSLCGFFGGKSCFVLVNKLLVEKLRFFFRLDLVTNCR